MRCPLCQSTRISRSESRDLPVYRLALLVRMRCHSCFAKFFVSCWSAAAAERLPERLPAAHRNAAPIVVPGKRKSRVERLGG